MFALIWAQDINNIIGFNNKLPWKLSNDLKNFKNLTLNNTIIIGRKTFESINKNLKKRKIIILSKNKNFKKNIYNKNIIIMNSKEEILEYKKKYLNEIFFIAGGELIYKIFLKYCNILYRTFINYSFIGNKYFPKINWNNWIKIFSKNQKITKYNKYNYKFEIFIKNFKKER